MKKENWLVIIAGVLVGVAALAAGAARRRKAV